MYHNVVCERFNHFILQLYNDIALSCVYEGVRIVRTIFVVWSKSGSKVPFTLILISFLMVLNLVEPITRYKRNGKISLKYCKIVGQITEFG